MSVLRPRNRLVNFRLSEDEFEKLRASCSVQGARSISDFARSSVLDRIERGSNGFSGPTRVHQLDHKVLELETRVGQLLNLVQATGSNPATVVAETLSEAAKHS